METIQENKKPTIYPEPKFTVQEVLNDGGIMSTIFPNYKQRDEQIRLSSDIQRVIEEGGTLVSEASTGTGKSVAYLTPAILKPDWKFVVSTATKALQEQLFYKDIPLLQEVFKKIGINFNAVLVKGRGNYISIRRYMEYSKELDYTYFEQHRRVGDWFDNSDGDFESLDFTLDPSYKSKINSTSDDCEGKDCPFYEQCKFYKKKQEASRAKIMIVNHDLLSTDLVLKHKLGYGTLPNYDGIILDEAHNFEDVITKYLGYRVSKYAISNLKAPIGKLIKNESDFDEDLSKEINLTINKSIKFAEKFFDLFYPNGDVMRIRPNHIDTSAILYSRKLQKSMDSINDKLSKHVYYHEDAEDLLSKISDRIEEFNSRIVDIMNIENNYSEYVYWSTTSPKTDDVFIENAPIEVTEHTRKMLFSRDTLDNIKAIEESLETRILKTVILTSATIATNNSFYYIKERLGIEDDADECVVGSPFNYKKQSLFHIPKDIVEPVGSRENLEAFTRLSAQNIINLVNASKGKALILFTSYAEMDKVYKMTHDKIKYPVYKQGDFPKNVLTEKFKEEIDSVLFATSSFREGVSIEGESLSLVIMDKLPFPVPTEPIIEARIEKMKADGFNWFDGYYIPIATIALKQGFGRLIRTVDDFGCFTLLDKRVVTKGYGYKFLNSLPDMLQTRKYDKVVRYYEIIEQIREVRRDKGRRV